MAGPNITTTPGNFYCPSCGAWIEAAVHACPRCQFTAELCLRKYHYQAPFLERFVDPDHRLTTSERHRLDKDVDSFEALFPQIEFYICITRLPENADSREFGYWLFNAATPRDAAEEQRRHFSMLLLIDRGNRTTSLTTGYRLNAIVDDFPLHNLLQSSRADFHCGKYADGIASFVNRLKPAMKTIYRNAIRSHRAASATPAPQKPSQSPSKEEVPVHAVSDH